MKSNDAATSASIHCGRKNFAMISLARELFRISSPFQDSILTNRAANGKQSANYGKFGDFIPTARYRSRRLTTLILAATQRIAGAAKNGLATA
jgi:hypothetical protein